MPGSAIQSRARIAAPLASSSPTCAVTMRSVVDIDARRLEVEHADHARPRRRARRALADRIRICRVASMPSTVCGRLRHRRRGARAGAARRLGRCPRPTRTPRCSTRSRCERREVEVLGGTTAYWVYGPADAETTIVAVHGFRGEHHGLEPVVAHLPGVRIISPDLPGFGETPPLPGPTPRPRRPTPSGCATFAAAVAPGAVILGHSFGSIVVAAAVAGGPATTPRVILVNPIGAPALEGPRGILTRLAVFYYWAGARLPKRVGDGAAAQRRDRAGDERLDGEDARRRSPPVHPRPARHVLLALRRPRRAARRVPRVGLARRARVRARGSPSRRCWSRRSATTSRRSRRSATSPRCSPMPSSSRSPDVGHLIHYETPAPAAEAIRRFLAPSAPGTR